MWQSKIPAREDNATQVAGSANGQFRESQRGAKVNTIDLW